jgi:ferredoxin
MSKIILEDNSHETSETYSYSENQTIFDALEAQGTTLPHGCLAGSCGSCRIEIKKGNEYLSPPSAIENNTIESLRKMYPEVQHIRLSCRTRLLPGDNHTVTLNILKKKSEKT